MKSFLSSRSRRALLSTAAFAAALNATALPANAQAYPERPIRMVVPFPAGGPTDIFARILSDKLSNVLGQPIVIDNRAGANGNIGAALAAQAKPDGYTVLFATASIAIAPSMYSSLSYDLGKDLTPVALVGSVPSVLLVHPESPQSVRGLVDTMKANPGKMTYASSGKGSPAHLTTELFKSVTKTDAVHVSYRGSAPAMQETAAKRHLFMFETLSSIKPLVSSGHLKPLAIAANERSPLFPNVPTLSELGIEGVTGGTWNMVFVPSGTPAAVVNKLNAAFNAVLADQAVAARLTELAIAGKADSTPTVARSFLTHEVKRWSVVVEASGARVE